MANNITPQNPSQEANQLSPDESRANLGLITALMQHMVPEGQDEGSQTPESAPGEAETPTSKNPQPKEEKGSNKEIETKMMEMELSLSKKMDDLGRKIEELTKKEDQK